MPATRTQMREAKKLFRKYASESHTFEELLDLYVAAVAEISELRKEIRRAAMQKGET